MRSHGSTKTTKTKKSFQFTQREEEEEEEKEKKDLSLVSSRLSLDVFFFTFFLKKQVCLTSAFFFVFFRAVYSYV